MIALFHPTKLNQTQVIGTRVRTFLEKLHRWIEMCRAISHHQHVTRLVSVDENHTIYRNFDTSISCRHHVYHEAKGLFAFANCSYNCERE